MDDWWDRLYREPDGGPDATRDDRATGEKKHRTDADHALVSVSRGAEAGNTPAPHIPPPASRWGSGRALDSFLRENPAHPGLEEDAPTVNTPEESEELRKHEEKLNEEATEKSEEPQEKTPEEENNKEGTRESEPTEKGEEKEWKKRLREAKEGAGKKLHKASVATAPARKGTATAFNSISPSKGEPFSFFWSFVAAWLVSPQIVVAAADRIALLFGASRPLSGPEEPLAWGFLNGPGVWFQGQLSDYWGSGDQGRLLLLAVVGIAPVLVAQVSDGISSVTARKFLLWFGYGFPAFFICSVSYFPIMGFHSWDELYVTALFATAWWGFSFSRTVGPGPTQFLLRIPLASIVFGVVSNSPGALF